MNFHFRFPCTIFTRGTGGEEKTQKQINLLSWPRPLNHLGHGRTSYTNIAIWSHLGWQVVWGETIMENVTFTKMYLAFRMPSLSSIVPFMAYTQYHILGHVPMSKTPNQNFKQITRNRLRGWLTQFLKKCDKELKVLVGEHNLQFPNKLGGEPFINPRFLLIRDL